VYCGRYFAGFQPVTSSVVLFYFSTLKKAAADTPEFGTPVPRYTRSERSDDGELPVYNVFLVAKTKITFAVCRKSI
jgi:hypothetical protein